MLFLPHSGMNCRLWRPGSVLQPERKSPKLAFFSEKTWVLWRCSFAPGVLGRRSSSVLLRGDLKNRDAYSEILLNFAILTVAQRKLSDRKYFLFRPNLCVCVLAHILVNLPLYAAFHSSICKSLPRPQIGKRKHLIYAIVCTFGWIFQYQRLKYVLRPPFNYFCWFFRFKASDLT
jgi:hypothetical protein